ncbi:MULTISPECIES: guanylate kinase [Bartonella]|uniref:guanylate kinase n=1 Tax=Bartonella TaxID=773 RepID=UPI0018DC5478|nr:MULTISPECIES: guanylate kinase [Bartonella]MBH9994696.1 guanylate kinase [Bartonella sp. P0291]MBH9996959.1 guanylate kinase [Bartonella sp. M0192]MBH9999119.1 guanylate kinase [Bartonella sp. M0191]MBI0007499.1 guanylate kinase [Bartonella sp. M0193]MBI0010410.1 guanylate kinase [Bartonella sp. M0176]
MENTTERALNLKNTGKRRGVLLVLSSPSGAGKSTLSRLLLEDGHLGLSVSVTTRERRPSEVNGVHYHFITRKEFEQKRDNNELIEWAEVHGHYYGTLRETVETALASGRDMLFDIDYQGARQLQEKMPDDVVSVFILPPSMKELKSRLNRRAEDSQDVINLRLHNARGEIEHFRSYDYVIINQDLEQSFALIKAIHLAEAIKRRRCLYIDSFVKSLLEEKIE